MSSEIGHIQIHRQLLSWEWYADITVRLTFIHLLIIANWEDKEWKGMTIKRGQIVVGRKKLSKEIGISEQQLRTSLLKLKSTSEITIKSTNRFSVVTLVKYNDYQYLKKKSTNKKTDQQPTDNQQITTTKERKKERSTIPTKNEFLIYAKEKDNSFDLKKQNIILKYEAWIENGWKTGTNKPIKNWKSTLLNTLSHIPKEFKKQNSNRL